MSQLSGKHIILGVTGSISAYKAAVLAREFKKHNADLRVVMTTAASAFIAPLTFSTISNYPVVTEMFPAANTPLAASGSWHIDWAQWADAMIIAPASAATIAKLAVGLSDNALTVVATALRGQLFVAPAMDSDMLRYPALSRNIETLRSFGAQIIPPEEGFLASGLTGPGRLAEPETIVKIVSDFFLRSKSLAGIHVLITAGPTHEPIDAVRYIANSSSGKMGYALAGEALARGARVTLVSGPTHLPPPPGADLLPVITAAEMAAAVDACSDSADIIIAAAAVADFTPVRPASVKLKRRELISDDNATISLELQSTTDILGNAGKRKKSGQIIVGFALEAGADLLESARAKLTEKRCDMIVANSATEAGAGFTHDTNKITIVTPDSVYPLPLMPKRQCATEIFDALERIPRSVATAGSGSDSEQIRSYA